MIGTFEHDARAATLTLLRAGAGLLFMQHGVQKLFGWLDGRQVETIWSIMGLAGILETFGGLLIVLGLLTRPVALVLAVEMLIAYVWRHLPQGPWPILNRGEPAMLFMLVFAFLAAHGAGPFSVDRLLGRARRD